MFIYGAPMHEVENTSSNIASLQNYLKINKRINI
jgi:hypothetical protein